MLVVKEGLIMPGLIEAHCHMGITEEKKGMEGDDCNETVDPVTPYLRAIDGINPMDAAPTSTSIRITLATAPFVTTASLRPLLW